MLLSDAAVLAGKGGPLHFPGLASLGFQEHVTGPQGVEGQGLSSFTSVFTQHLHWPFRSIFTHHMGGDFKWLRCYNDK